ncbi:DUF72 domain-containing protein [Leifsonia sp. H3M29-4]|uniref:DUF72 domain-containing protein n=1 Tax=Salinibacterium metalliresistens TaxID=3031321 RepID=UPI0023D9BBA8|nr:DUF72 domain-containing protein [Salinibacterium metalliresistens]MDF1480278.1 DUF72 domain-containing protein [Salinibacterium metalliresistens]
MTERGTARVGMAGWVYPDWRGTFYPKGTTQKTELEYASRHVTSIELNGSFYSLQKPSSWVSWRDRTPEDFVFSVKAPKFITHERKLENVREPLANFFASGLLALGPKLGCVLWQLPPSLGFDPARLETFLAQLPHTTTEAVELAAERSAWMTGKEHLETDADRPVRHAIEVRHHGFDRPEFIELLRRYRVAAVLGETAGKWPMIDETTTDFRYVRLHADEVLREGGVYDEAAIAEWAARIETWLAAGLDAYVYFDNDTKVRAPIDAMSLIARLNS